MILSESRPLQIVLGAAVVTSELPIVVSWADILNDASTFAPNDSLSITTGSTPVTALAAPAAGTKRQVKYLSVLNSDTAPATVVIEVGSTRVLRVTLLPDYRLEYTFANGFRVLNASGAFVGVGPQGDIGPDGPPGRTAEWLTGTGTPSSGDGEDGDRYLQSNGDVWRKDAGSWAATGVNLKGDNGTPGVVQSLVAGNNITIDSSDPANPIVTAEAASAAIKIAVIGDSFATQNTNMSPAWPAILEQQLRACGENVEVYNCAVAGHTFFRANTQARFGTKTAVQHAIDLEPDIVVVALGFNDLVLEVDARDTTTVQADAATTFSALRAALPDAKILYMGERAYDATNFPTPETTLLNKGTIGTLFQKKTTGILANCWTVELLDDAVSSLTRIRLGNWRTLDTSCRSNANIDSHSTLDLWRIHRMGGALFDMLHVGPASSFLMASYTYKALTNAAYTALLPGLLVNSNTIRNDPDALFTAMFSASGTNWNYVATDSSVQSVEGSLWGQLRPHNWYLPRNIVVTNNVRGDSTLSLSSPGAYIRTVHGLPPGAMVSVSVNGAAFSTPILENTAPSGDVIAATGVVNLYRSFGAGSNTYRHKYDDIVCDPVTFSILDDSPGFLDLTGSTTLGLAHINRSLRYNSTNPGNLTIPNDSTVVWPNYAQFELMQGNTGAATFVAGIGVTLRKQTNLTFTTGGQYAVMGAKRVGPNEWVVFGHTG